MSGLLCDKNVVEFYTKNQELALQTGADKRFPNLSLVRLASRYFAQSSGRVLDYGCGGGANFIFLLEKGFEVHGTDTSKYSIEIINRKLDRGNYDRKNAHLAVLDLQSQKLPYPDNYFDFIVCASVLSLLSTKDRIDEVLKEFRRVIKPNGKLFLDINGPNSEFAIFSEKINEDTYIYRGRNKNEDAIQVICPPSKEVFMGMVSKFFQVDEIGVTAHRFFEYAEEEFIACARKI